GWWCVRRGRLAGRSSRRRYAEQPERSRPRSDQLMSGRRGPAAGEQFREGKMTMHMRVAVAVLGLAAVITSGCSQLSGDEPIDREPAAAVEVDEAPSAPEISAEPEQAEASSA